MRRPLSVLVVEDSEDDLELLLRELNRGGYEVAFRRVETSDQMRSALADRLWDLVIADYSLPAFGALGALAILDQQGEDIPLLIVSGTVGEENAVNALKAGAHDFIMKDRMTRLLPAIERELREGETRRRHREAEESRRKVEAQLLVADRMVSVGTLAAGVAHEINNPLAALIANLEFAVADAALVAQSKGAATEALAALKAELDDARTAAERIRLIVRDLKVFSRAEEEKRGPVDVERVMESTLRMASNEIRHRAKLVRNFGKIPLVDASESRLGQVFLNLVVNAAHAMAEGHADRNEIRVNTRLELGRVVVEIADTGPGIPESVMKRIFSPFVTTKPAGVGTGLGLSICHRLVTEMGGEIAVENSPGKGALFRLSLPPSGAAEEVRKPVPPGADSAPRRGKILVVDDEAMLVKVVERTLASEHEVAGASRAKEALQRIVGGERFDLILCDLMMPEMTGMEFHAELKERVPQQAEVMVFLTGGAFTEGTRAFLDRVPNLTVEKPFDPGRLRALVGERLRATPTPK